MTAELLNIFIYHSVDFLLQGAITLSYQISVTPDYILDLFLLMYCVVS